MAVHPDAEGQCQQSHGGETGVFVKASNGVAKIVKHRFRCYIGVRFRVSGARGKVTRDK